MLKKLKREVHSFNMLIKRIFKTLLIILAIAAGLFFFYFNNTRRVKPETKAFYSSLKKSLQQKGYSTKLLVVSTKRVKWHNDLLAKSAGAAKNSRHLVGEAIDFIVFDINKDGKSDSQDVDIVYALLDKEIIKNHGGIGTYKNEHSFIYRQMIHIDCRGYQARWAK